MVIFVRPKNKPPRSENKSAELFSLNGFRKRWTQTNYFGCIFPTVFVLMGGVVHQWAQWAKITSQDQCRSSFTSIVDVCRVDLRRFAICFFHIIDVDYTVELI